MKLKDFVIPIIIFLLGLAMTIIGALFKIIHFEIGPLTGNLILTIGNIFEVVAILAAIIKLIIFYRKN